MAEAMEQALDLGKALGATPETSITLLRLYLPNKSRDDSEFNPAPWLLEASEILARIGGGFTMLGPLEGGFLKRSGRVQREKTVVIYTYIKPARFVKELKSLREFLHRFGRETRQSEVVVELDGNGESRFFRIRRFDDEERAR